MIPATILAVFRPAASLLLVASLTLVVSSAEAKPKTYAVRIDSEPPGARVYVDDQEAGAVGETPVDLQLTAGTHTVILELADHEISFSEVVVKAQKKRQAFALTLEALKLASLVIRPDNAAAQGAKIVLDGVEVGVVPLTLDAEPGPHQVQVIRDGYVVFEEWIEATAGEEYQLPVSLRVEVPDPGPDGDGEGGGVVAPAKPRGPRPPLVSLGAGFDFVWRRFRYEEPMTANLRPFDANGIGAFALYGELYPWHIATAPRFLRSLYGIVRLEFGFPLTSRATNGSEIDSYWRQIDVGARYRLRLGSRASIDFDTGWGNTMFAFGAGSLAAEVPDVRYHFLRLGARGNLAFGRMTTWLGLENHIVFAGGPLGDRFRAADVDGVAGNAGVAVRVWKQRLELRAQLAFERYGWTFESVAGDAYIADGGSDQFYGFSLGALATY
jgi:hypothetical protein